MKKSNSSISGFSLVEVTLALGVVVFCLVVILGLLAVGVNSTRVSTAQTAATNILTAVTSDLESTPNITASYTPVSAKGSVTKPSLIYGISVPGTGATSTNPQTFYLADNGLVTTQAAALYRLSVWTYAASATSPAHQETFVRLLITWPAQVAYASAQNYVENVVAINRT